MTITREFLNQSRKILKPRPFYNKLMGGQCGAGYTEIETINTPDSPLCESLYVDDRSVAA